MERWIIRLKTPVPKWRLRAGESLMVDVVSKQFEEGTTTFRSIYDGSMVNLRIDAYEVLSTGGLAPIEDATQGSLL